MPAPVATDTRTMQLRARTTAVSDHHYDTSNRDKPLFLLVPGGAVALASLIFGAWRVYFGFLDEHALKPVPPEVTDQIVLALVLYFGGLFIFSLGYELYDVKKAALLAVVAGIIGIAVAAVAIVLVYALAAMLGGKKSSGGRSSSRGGAGLGVARLFGRTANMALSNVNVGLNPGAILPTISTAKPGCCSKCDQPLDPSRALPDGAYLDENLYCPRCRQPYEAVGLKTVDKQPAPPPPPAAPIAPQAAAFIPLNEATCLACGGFLPVGADGVCSSCFRKLSRVAGA